MKKYILLVFVLLLSVQPTNAGAKKEVVIFSQPCHYCDKMKEALKGGIIAANPDIQFTILDIQDAKNRRLLQKFARRHKLDGDIGLPLLFIGENYLMGWGPGAAEELQGHIEALKQEKVSRIPVNLMKK